MKEFPTPVVSVDKECGECTACCDGWLTGNIRGYEMKPGNPCHFRVEKTGCGIYPERPQDPCKNFVCEWKINEEWPDFLRPDKAGVIVSLKKTAKENFWFFSAKETGKKIDSYILSCLIQYCRKQNRDLYYEIEGRWWALGSDEFMNYMREIK